VLTKSANWFGELTRDNENVSTTHLEIKRVTDNKKKAQMARFRLTCLSPHKCSPLAFGYTAKPSFYYNEWYGGGAEGFSRKFERIHYGQGLEIVFC
jgi:hypothetical protein